MVTTVALKDKIQEMYPEIGGHRLSAAVDFDAVKNAYIVTFRREGGAEEPHRKKRR